MRNFASMKRVLLWLLPLTITVAGCGGKKGHENEHESGAAKKVVAEPTGPRFEVDSKFQGQLSAAFEAYLKLKDAFVASDAEEARAAAAQAQAVLTGIDGNDLTGAAENDWNAYRAGMAQALDGIKNESDLENQRELFSDLTASMYESVKAFGLGGGIAYYEYCPMAFDNQGGYWLSDSEIIRNPYFGDEMLACGSVQEKLR